MPNEAPQPSPLRVDLSPILGDLLSRAYSQKGHHTVRATLAEMKRDLGVWAEADIIANDGITLQAADLAEYLIKFRGIPREIVTAELIRESMDIYRRHLESPHRRGPRRRAFCKRSHPRTPDNLTVNGACKDCVSAARKRTYAARKGVVQK